MAKDTIRNLIVYMSSMGALRFAYVFSSAQVYGMPKAAYEIGAVKKQLPFSEILREVVMFN